LNFALAKHHRLLTSQDFSRVFGEADYKIGSRHLLILGCRSDMGHARLGLVVSKKHVGAAVHRNRLKRLGREVFRLRRAELPAIDMLVIARLGIGSLNNQQVLVLLNQQVDALIRQCKSSAERGDPQGPSC
jgi:ribonuclease P protein component